MNLLQMSISGAVMILVVIVIRTLAINRLPKKTFLILWGIVLLRLLVSVSFPSPFSAYSFVNRHLPVEQSDTGLRIANTLSISPNTLPVAGDIVPHQTVTSISPYLVVWGIGFVLCALFFTVSYLKCHIEFRESQRIKNEFLANWIAEHHTRRPIAVKQSSRITTPLTYGILKPIILLPKNTNWDNTKQMQYILEHEFVHIRRFDAVLKLLLTAALCIHWFNPLVWAMYVLSNQDIELSCDETVVRSFGETTKSAYALTLISMEEKKSGLTPLCNNFSKNVIEERVTAIMKIKKKSIIATFVAIAIIVGVTIFFATSVASSNKTLTAIPNTKFTQGEYDQLLALRFDGYQNMTVADYQEKVWTIMDTHENMELYERFNQDTQLYDMRYTNETASFLFNTLIPLTAEHWLTQDFGGHVFAPDGYMQGDPAMLEYQMTLIISNANGLTVGEYEKARSSIKSELEKFFQAQSVTNLQDESVMKPAIQTEIEAVKSEWQTKALQVEIEFSFKPFDNVYVTEWYREEWENTLKPYIDFGLSYSFLIDGIEMRFNNKEVQGIYDETHGLWISDHAGNSTYSDGAIELFTVYTNGKLSGLREATKDEQARFTEMRENTPTPENEERAAGSGTEADYQSLLKLKTEDYQNQSAADFNKTLLKWANEDYERNDRINLDAAWNDFQVSLTDEERSFITLTVRASGEENAKLIQSHYTDRAKEDPLLGSYSLSKEINDNERTAWASLYYQLTYHISDDTIVTIGERDRILSDVIHSIQNYWDTTDIDTLLSMDSNKLKELLNTKISRYNNDLVEVSFSQNNFQLEAQSEPKMRD